jgi:hypothetical protein
MTLKAKVLTLTLVLAPVAAHAAATPGVKQGTMMIGAERLFGLGLSHESTATANGSTSTDNTTFTLLYSSAPNVHMTPRVTFDFALIDGLTLGGGLGFGVGNLDQSASRNNATTNSKGPTSTWLVISPRAGYVLGLNQLAGLWLRGGFTYYYINTDFPTSALNTSSSSRLTGLSFDLEPTLLLSPWQHLGFTAGLAINLPLTGSSTTEVDIGSSSTTTSVDHTIRNVGILFGMEGTF